MRERCKGGDPTCLSLSHSHKLRKTPSHSHVPQCATDCVLRLPHGDEHHDGRVDRHVRVRDLNQHNEAGSWRDKVQYQPAAPYCAPRSLKLVLGSGVRMPTGPWLRKDSRLILSMSPVSLKASYVMPPCLAMCSRTSAAAGGVLPQLGVERQLVQREAHRVGDAV